MYSFLSMTSCTFTYHNGSWHVESDYTGMTGRTVRVQRRNGSQSRVVLTSEPSEGIYTFDNV